MKTKKLNLNKTTVSNLRAQELKEVKGGIFTYHSCNITAQQCPTDVLCTGGEWCECTFDCTLPCPIDASIRNCDVI